MVLVLFMASQQGYTGIVKLLLEHNHTVDLCDMDGRSPLFMASQQGHTDIVKLLLEMNSNVDLCDSNGFTPLIESCSNNNTSIIQLLLTHKPNIDAQIYDGGRRNNTGFYACEVGHEDVVRLLLDKGAHTQICRFDGKSPLDSATDNGHTSIVCMVTEHMKKEDLLSY
ncbi:unnamed protein product [Mytilus edulis]|uniref:Uncharacterized protein n=1 Tax=Mytilus edulis TaxID=6550 RepID=A0A8S3SSB7_MYTED|nr:unnamed protein product [Mytilus edulis]